MESLNRFEPQPFMPIQFGKLVGLLEPFGQEALSLVGKRVDELSDIRIPPHLQHLAFEASLNGFHLSRWMSRFIRPNGNGVLEINQNQPNIKLNIRYLSQFMKTPTLELEDDVARKLDKHTKEQRYIHLLSKKYPLLSHTSLQLLDQYKGSTAKNKRKKTSWYERFVDSAVETDQHIDSFFGKLQIRQQKLVGNRLVDEYLEDVKKDLRLHNAEVLNAGNAYAIFNQLYGNDGILLHGMRVGVSYGDFFDVVKEIQSFDVGNYPDGRPSVYSSMAKKVIDANGFRKPEDREVVVPIISGSYDILKYSYLLRNTWEELNEGLDLHYPHVSYSRDPRISSVQIGRRGSIFMRPFPQIENGRQMKEARLAIQLGDTSFRTDCDYRRMVMSMDFGHAGIDDVLKLMECIYHVDEIQTIGEVLSSQRSVNQFIEDHGFGPSLMTPYGEKGLQYGLDDPFSDSNKFAIMASIVSGGGEDTGMRMNTDWFGYHSREHVNKRAYLENFPMIVYALTQSLTSAA